MHLSPATYNKTTRKTTMKATDAAGNDLGIATLSGKGARVEQELRRQLTAGVHHTQRLLQDAPAQRVQAMGFSGAGL